MLVHTYRTTLSTNGVALLIEVGTSGLLGEAKEEGITFLRMEAASDVA